MGSERSSTPDREIPTRLQLKVVPGASRSEIVGWLGDELKVRVAAPPEKGKANAAVEALVARALSLPPRAVTLISGASSAHKAVEIQGLSRDDIFRILDKPAE
jgi:uncharacterized protein (TIGR00251 family)